MEWFLAGALTKEIQFLVLLSEHMGDTELAPNLEADSLIRDIVTARKETSPLGGKTPYAEVYL